jgi:vacuolar-type H+-ATPase subunit B/Vma2
MDPANLSTVDLHYPEISLGINGMPINPAVRTHPSRYQTGISAIDGLNTAARGKAAHLFEPVARERAGCTDRSQAHVTLVKTKAVNHLPSYLQRWDHPS